jgi:hypothetical protein
MIPTPPVDDLSIEDARKIIHGLTAVICADPDHSERIANEMLADESCSHFHEELRFTSEWLDRFADWVTKQDERN